MKYEEKVTYRTTASGGQETITEMAPVYNRLEKRAMRRRAMKDEPKEPSEKGVLHGLTFIVKHPTFCLIVVGLIAIFAVYMISSANSTLNELVEQYTSLTARKDDSKYSFDKRLFYITVNADGTKTVTFGYKSEVAQEDAEEAAEQAGNTGTSPNVDYTVSNANGHPVDSHTLDDKSYFMEGAGNIANKSYNSVNAEKIWYFMKGYGYNDFAAAAIVGSALIESDLIPHIGKNSKYTGLWQLGGGRKDNMLTLYNTSQPEDEAIKAQCLFTVYEVSAGKGDKYYDSGGAFNCNVEKMNDPYTYYSEVVSGSVRDSAVNDDAEYIELCTFLWTQKYERCVTENKPWNFSNRVNAYQGFAKRTKAAQYFYHKFSGKEPGEEMKVWYEYGYNARP